MPIRGGWDNFLLPIDGHVKPSTQFVWLTAENCFYVNDTNGKKLADIHRLGKVIEHPRSGWNAVNVYVTPYMLFRTFKMYFNLTEVKKSFKYCFGVSTLGTTVRFTRQKIKQTKTTKTYIDSRNYSLKKPGHGLTFACIRLQVDAGDIRKQLVLISCRTCLRWRQRIRHLANGLRRCANLVCCLHVHNKPRTSLHSATRLIAIEMKPWVYFFVLTE